MIGMPNPPGDCELPQDPAALESRTRPTLLISTAALTRARIADATARDDGPIAGCERYFAAIAARDIEAVLEAMTADYAAPLRSLRRQPDFQSFFALWCDAQGRLRSVLACSIDGAAATVLLDAGNTVVRVTLCRVQARWLIDGEQVERSLRAR